MVPQLNSGSYSESHCTAHALKKLFVVYEKFTLAPYILSGKLTRFGKHSSAGAFPILGPFPNTPGSLRALPSLLSRQEIKGL